MRKKISDLALAAMLLALSFPAAAQQQAKKIPRIGVASPGRGNPNLDAFLQGLHKLGWVDGQNIVIEYRWAKGNEERLFEHVAELVRINVDIIVAPTVRAADAARKLTKTIPIVVTVIPGPSQNGLVQSLGQPGGNVTGLSNMSTELSGKRLELLKEISPKISRVAVLANWSNVGRPEWIKEIKAVAPSLSVQLQMLNVKKPEEIANAFSAAVRGKAEAVTVGSHVMFVQNRTRIVELAAKYRLPAMYIRSEFVEAGGLMSYGPDNTDLYRQAAIYVDKILKGIKPSDLPVEQPTKFELVINLKTAKTLGLEIPSNVLMWADRVIE
jgi:putative ABC transport system substrate-binding protein